MDGIYENIRNFWDSAGKFRKNTWTEIGRKRTELSGKWTEIPGTPKSAKGCVASEVDGKNMNGRNFLQNLFGQKFVSIEVPGILNLPNQIAMNIHIIHLHHPYWEGQRKNTNSESLALDSANFRLAIKWPFKIVQSIQGIQDRSHELLAGKKNIYCYFLVLPLFVC